MGEETNSCRGQSGVKQRHVSNSGNLQKEQHCSKRRVKWHFYTDKSDASVASMLIALTTARLAVTSSSSWSSSAVFKGSLQQCPAFIPARTLTGYGILRSADKDLVEMLSRWMCKMSRLKGLAILRRWY